MATMSLQDLAGLQGREFTIVAGDVPDEGYEDEVGVTLTLRSDADTFLQAQLMAVVPCLGGELRMFALVIGVGKDGTYGALASVTKDNTVTIHIVSAENLGVSD